MTPTCGYHPSCPAGVLVCTPKAVNLFLEVSADRTPDLVVRSEREVRHTESGAFYVSFPPQWAQGLAPYELFVCGTRLA